MEVKGLWLEVTTSRRKHILVCAIYRPPSSGKVFLENFLDILERVAVEAKEALFLGDFNIDCQSDSPISRQMKDICKGSGLEQMIQSPTRLTNSTRTLNDHVYTSSSNCISEAGCLDIGVSDHMMVFATMKGTGRQSTTNCQHT